jgi:hypothetical protein
VAFTLLYRIVDTLRNTRIKTAKKHNKRGCFKLQWSESVNNEKRGEATVNKIYSGNTVMICRLQWCHVDCSDGRQTTAMTCRLQRWHADCSDEMQTAVMTCRLQWRKADYSDGRHTTVMTCRLQWWHADYSDGGQTTVTEADCSDGRQTTVMTCRLQWRKADYNDDMQTTVTEGRLQWRRQTTVTEGRLQWWTAEMRLLKSAIRTTVQNMVRSAFKRGYRLHVWGRLHVTLTPWCTVLLENPPVSWLVTKSAAFMTPRGSLSCWQQLTTCPYSASIQPTPSHPISLHSILILSGHLANIFRVVFFLHLAPPTVYAIQSTFPAHLNPLAIVHHGYK